MELNKLRDQIDSIDEQILALLNKRVHVALDIGRFKEREKLPFYDPARERLVFEKLRRMNKDSLFPQHALEVLYREIMSATLSLEKLTTVAYLGPQATYTHQAAAARFGGSAEYVPVNNIRDVFIEVERERVAYGVVPIENSTEGVVNHTLDMFIDSDLKIFDEIAMNINHNLLTNCKSLEEIDVIYSHPQPFAQCRDWMESNIPQVRVLEEFSTAAAVSKALKTPQAAAIASSHAAHLYGLPILVKNIQDNPDNQTRFLVISKVANRTSSAKDKTSILFSIKDEAGALYQTLEPFYKRGISLSKIESRPSRKRMWEYIFFADIHGSSTDEAIQAAIADLKKKASFIKLLGTYPEST